ncbi:MAG: acetyl-CoA carboxylase carboxyltransferase subunit alpha [Actinobacteria bacterium]|nr:acetyl-CoA carboxylase carboxyltransferase subunit alpha [Actinomycetota bacterium]
MEVDKIKNLPKSFLKDSLKSIFKIEKLKRITGFTGVHFNDAEKKLAQKIENYRHVEREALKTWRIVQLSRDEKRPHTPDYINGIFEDFIQLSGDRLGMDDKSIITGLGRLDGRTVAVIGHNKGKDIKERVEFNFGSSMPQGYRKAMRIMEIAQRFGFPVITFIDTPGAYPALEAEDSGQAGAIAKSICTMFSLTVPTITVLIGEGGSGGALALAIGNYVMMLENSTYSVISPEGCASILWRDSSVARLASRALKLTSRDLFKLGVIDKIIYEPAGGAHNNPERMIRIVRSYLKNTLKKFCSSKDFDFKKHRAQKYEAMGFVNLTDRQKV